MIDCSWLDEGTVYINGVGTGSVSQTAWAQHPRFDGVFTKNIFTGAASGGIISAMAVKIEPHREIGGHVHEGKTELHLIIYGEGVAEINGKKIVYRPGVVSLVPADVCHSIRAGAPGMVILAKFTPALN